MSPLRPLKRILRQIAQLRFLAGQVADAKVLSARLLINQIRSAGLLGSLRDAEFKVFSQFGDDGIIQYLVHRTSIARVEESFIEFGVHDYEESNTRFLLINDNWRGLVMDSGAENMKQVRNSDLYWRHDLTAISTFIDADNIDGLISGAGFGGDIGLLSIDIDGNDYWVWERIQSVSPIIVVAEYNSLFGAEHAVSIPYDPQFRRETAHHSNLYWGCSLAALDFLGRRKGYALVGSNSAGNNAYFVRRDRMSGLAEKSVKEAYVESRYRESRDSSGHLTYLSGADRLRAIRHLPVRFVDRDDSRPIGDILLC